jgi:integrase
MPCTNASSRSTRVQPRRRGRTRTARPKEQVWATPQHVLDIAHRVAHIDNRPAAMLIITAAWTGARWGELTGLHRRNLHLDDGVMLIDSEAGALHEGGGAKLWLGPPKNARSTRTITLPEFLIPLLYRQCLRPRPRRLRSSASHDPLVLAGRGGNLSVRSAPRRTGTSGRFPGCPHGPAITICDECGMRSFLVRRAAPTRHELP